MRRLSIAVVFWAYFAGCAQVQQAPTGKEVVFEETKGGVIAGIITNTWGTEVDSITLPTNPPTTVYLRDSDDPGLRCHEATHRNQIIMLGQFEFLRRYLAETVRAGYWANAFEVEAREKQAVCDGGGE